jgi:hypothetical protein
MDNDRTMVSLAFEKFAPDPPEICSRLPRKSDTGSNSCVCKEVVT